MGKNEFLAQEHTANMRRGRFKHRPHIYLVVEPGLGSYAPKGEQGA